MPPPHDPSKEFWQPEPLWLGDTVFILGGGPSLCVEDVQLAKKHGWILAVNSAFWIVPDCDALFFTDHSWFTGRDDTGNKRCDRLKGSKALLMTTSRMAKRHAPSLLRRLSVLPGAPFKVGRLPVRAGKSSGQTALGIAAALGGKRLVMLGFDMRRVKGRSHFHNEYANQNDKLYSENFGPAFRGWREAATKAGIEVINATPGSALTEFPIRNLREVL